MDEQYFCCEKFRSMFQCVNNKTSALEEELATTRNDHDLEEAIRLLFGSARDEHIPLDETNLYLFSIRKFVQPFVLLNQDDQRLGKPDRDSKNKITQHLENCGSARASARQRSKLENYL
jgi:hypothetical protein